MSAAIAISEELAAAVQRPLGFAAGRLYDEIGVALASVDLDDAARRLWSAYGAGSINDDEATFLAEYIGRRRPPARKGPLRGLVGRISRFPRRRQQRSPDLQKSYERRLRLAYSGALPDKLAARARLTLADMAVAVVISKQCGRRRFCDFPLDKIAALAGVCRKTAKRAVQHLCGQGLISVTERPQRPHWNDTNLIKIISREWLDWLTEWLDRLTKKAKSFDACSGGHWVAPTYIKKEIASEIRQSEASKASRWKPPDT
jgi:CRP-like cAMP-binding protein